LTNPNIDQLSRNIRIDRQRIWRTDLRLRTRNLRVTGKWSCWKHQNVAPSLQPAADPGQRRQFSEQSPSARRSRIGRS